MHGKVAKFVAIFFAPGQNCKPLVQQGTSNLCLLFSGGKLAITSQRTPKRMGEFYGLGRVFQRDGSKQRANSRDKIKLGKLDLHPLHALLV